MKWVNIAIYTVAVLLVLVIGYQMWAARTAYKVAHKTLPDMVFGPEDSDVSVTEFMDYRCGACRATHEEVKKAIAANPDVRFTVRHLPVFGLPSVIEADMALTAARHGKFKEMHEILITRENAVTEEEILTIAESLGLDTKTFRQEMQSGENGATLQSTLMLSKTLGVTSTPTFLINNRVFRATVAPVTADDLAAEIAAARADGKGWK